MRRVLRLLGFVCLIPLAAGCGVGATVGDDASASDNNSVTIELKFSFDGKGVLLGDEQNLVAFGTPKADFLAQTKGEFGQPLSIEINEECGAGPLEIANYPKQKFTITFQDGEFVGWMNNEDSDDFLSMRRSWLVKEPNFTMVKESSLGEEFSYGPEGETIYGLFKDKSADPAVISTWSGVNCIFR